MSSAGAIEKSREAFARAIALHRAGHILEAVRVYDEVLAMQPNNVDALQLRGVVAAQLRRYEEAEQWLCRALAIDPISVEANANRASIRNALRRFADALNDAERALAADPRHPSAHYQRGLALQSLRRLEEAVVSYERALEIRPDMVQALTNRGAAEHDLGRPEDALVSLDRALAIDPRNVEAYYNRGLVLQRLQRSSEALASYDKALEIRPDLPEAHNNRGLALQSLYRFTEAAACYNKALALKADFREALFNRATVLSSLGRHEEAIHDLDQVLEREPELPFARGARLHSRMHCCDWRDFHAEVERLVTDVRAGKPCIEPLPFVGISSSPRDQLLCARTWCRERIPSLPTNREHRRSHGGRIRVAYLSADFRDHATAHLAAGLFERHDRRRFETIAVAFGPEASDPMSARLERAFDRWLDIRNVSDRQAAELLARLEIDIAVDLKGFTDDARPGILALRPAPIQVNYLGYPGTIGAEHIDYIIADPIVIPHEDRAFYTERVVYLPGSYQVNDRERPTSEQAPKRTDAGLPNTGFVFCSFNNSWKITPRTFDVWMELLRKVEGSVLWLLEGHPAASANLRREAFRRGIDPGRLAFAPRIDLNRHLARHPLADLFLDTLPCNAHTTASDALWAGLPVLTQLGDSFAGRVAASLLHALGLPELVTTTESAYFEMAAELATDRARHGALRAKLARNRLSQPLFDADRYPDRLEAAYVTMWERWRRGESPEAFTVLPAETVI